MKAFLLIVISLIMSSCASILSRSDYVVHIRSIPSQANFKIVNRFGDVVESGTTPRFVSLPASAGFFTRADYLITVTAPGYEDRSYNLRAIIDPLYYVNILFGGPGLLGMLVVDPLTGAMYKLPINMVDLYLDEIQAQSDQGLLLLSLSELHPEFHAHLIPMNH